MTHALSLTHTRRNRSTAFGIVGFITGDLWMPRTAEVKEIRAEWRSDCDNPSAYNPCGCGAHHFDSLRDAVDALMVREDGDFSTAARLTADSYVYAERGDLHTTHTHRIDVGHFPSIATYVSDAFGFDAVYGD